MTGWVALFRSYGLTGSSDGGIVAEVGALLAENFANLIHINVARVHAAVGGDGSGGACGVACQPALGNLAHEAVAVGIATDVPPGRQQSVQPRRRHACGDVG